MEIPTSFPSQQWPSGSRLRRVRETGGVVRPLRAAPQEAAPQHIGPHKTEADFDRASQVEKTADAPYRVPPEFLADPNGIFRTIGRLAARLQLVDRCEWRQFLREINYAAKFYRSVYATRPPRGCPAWARLGKLPDYMMEMKDPRYASAEPTLPSDHRDQPSAAARSGGGISRDEPVNAHVSREVPNFRDTNLPAAAEMTNSKPESSRRDMAHRRLKARRDATAMRLIGTTKAIAWGIAQAISLTQRAIEQPSERGGRTVDDFKANIARLELILERCDLFEPRGPSGYHCPQCWTVSGKWQTLTSTGRKSNPYNRRSDDIMECKCCERDWPVPSRRYSEVK